MFQAGDHVVKHGDGLCRILGVEELSFGKERCNYYQLETLSGSDTRIYVPVDRAAEQMRPTMDREAAMALIGEIPALPPIEIVGEKQREQQYIRAIQSCEPKQWARIIKTMYFHKTQRAAEGKRPVSVDDRYFRLAEERLYAELGHALGEDREAVLRRIEAVAKAPSQAI